MYSRSSVMSGWSSVDRMPVDLALAREHVDLVRVVPGVRGHRRVRQVAVRQHARRCLERRGARARRGGADRRSGSRRDASRASSRLYAVESSLASVSAALAASRSSPCSGCDARMKRCSRRGHRSAAVFQYCSVRSRRRAWLIDDAIRRGQRLADDARGEARLARRCFRQPVRDARRPDFRRMRGPFGERRQSKRERHGAADAPECGRGLSERDDYTVERRKSTTISTWSRDKQHRRVTDTRYFRNTRTRSALAHRARRRARQQVGLLAAQHERRAADRIPQRPEVRRRPVCARNGTAIAGS